MNHNANRMHRPPLVVRAPLATVAEDGFLPTLLIGSAVALTVLEGAIRKWLLGGTYGAAAYAAYLSKDLVFISILFLRPLGNTSLFLHPFRKALMIGGIAVIAGAMFSSVQGVSPVGAALTLRSTIGLPLLAYFLVRRLPPRSGSVILWLATVFTLLNCGLGIVQNRLPPDHILNQYAASDTQIVALESGVRAAGTFAYITGLGIMSTVGVWAGLGLLSLARTLRQKAAGWISIVAGIGCGLASISRAPIIIAVVMIGLWAIFSNLGIHRVVASIAMAAVVLMCVALAGLLPSADRLATGLIQRNEIAVEEEEFGERAFGQTEEAVTAMVLAPLGNGLGFEQVGGNFFSTGNLTFANFEGQLPRIVMDLSVVGLVGYFLICGGALFALQMAKRTASKSEQSLLLVTQVLLVSIFYSSEVYNHTASSFAWIIFAVVLARCKTSQTRQATMSVSRLCYAVPREERM